LEDSGFPERNSLGVLDDVVVNALLGEVDDVEAEVAGLVVGLGSLAIEKP
jgi:hypothetical protein